MSEDHARVVSGKGLLPSAVLRSYIDDVLQAREINTRTGTRRSDPIPTPHVPTEIELWNAAVGARKAAKKEISMNLTDHDTPKSRLIHAEVVRRMELPCTR